MNDANKAALAALLGITQETHRWLAKKDYVYPNGCGHGNPRHLVGVRLDVSKLPDPLGPNADPVWAVPIMWWMKRKELNYDVGPIFSDDPTEAWCVLFYPSGNKPYYGSTITAALLKACLAARVPEIVNILE